MFSAEHIHEVIAHCMDVEVSDPKKTIIGGFIAIMYYGLLQMKEAYLIKVEDVGIVGEEDYRKIPINFDYQQKRKNEGFIYYVPNIPSPFSEIHDRVANKKCKDKMLSPKLEHESKKKYSKITREPCKKTP